MSTTTEGAERFRTADSGDIDRIVALVNSAYRGDESRRGWTTEAELLDGQRTDPVSLRQTLEAPGSVVLVLEEGGELRACVNLQRTEDGAYLGMLTVSPALQAAGIGRRLLEHAERYARQQWAVRRMKMTVIVQREELIAWYERRGYRRTGKLEPFPYGDPRFGLPRRSDLEFEVLEKPLA